METLSKISLLLVHFLLTIFNERIYVENIEVDSVNMPVAIYGDKEKPVNTVILKNIKAKHTLNKTNIIEREINFQEN